MCFLKEKYKKPLTLVYLHVKVLANDSLLKSVARSFGFCLYKRLCTTPKQLKRGFVGVFKRYNSHSICCAYLFIVLFINFCNIRDQ